MHLFRAWRALILFLLVMAGVRAPGAVLKEIRLAEHEGHTRAVFELDDLAKYTIANLSQSQGFVEIEFQDTSTDTRDFKRTGHEKLINSGLVIPLSGSNRVRVKLQTPEEVALEDFTLKNPTRIVLDVHKPVVSTYSRTSTSPVNTGPWKRRILIDPGHGGKDPGAVGSIGKRSVHEKTVVLDTSRRLANLLAADSRFDVALTRTGDSYVALGNRTRIAAQKDGDLFVSLHANAVAGRSAQLRARGFEIWIWNRESNYNAASRFVSKMEKDDAAVTRDNNPLLTKMMVDALESQALVSSQFADAVHSEFRRDSYFRSNDRGVKSARFKVLENYDMPSILVELGFMTHPSEVKLLNSASHQDRMARLLYNGIVEYYRRTDPNFPRSNSEYSVAKR